MLSINAALEDSSDAEDPPAKRDESSKESRRTALAKTLETVRARREALARETSATRRAVEAAAADKAEGGDAVESGNAVENDNAAEGNAMTVPRAKRLAALRDAAARKRKAPAEDGTRRIRVTRDARGDEQLELCGAPAEGASSVVMMAWERPYMEALVDALEVTPADTVLEIGYGLGFSCAAIQRRQPRRHVVIECDPNVRARIPDGVEVVSDYVPARWDRTPPQRGAASHGVEVAATTWQAYIDSVSFYDDAERFDAVFFDDFPIVATPSRGSRWRTFLQAVRPLLRPGCRVVGYCCDAERLRAALPIGYSLVSVAPFALTPPADCPYVSEAAGDRCVVAVIKHIIL